MFVNDSQIILNLTFYRYHKMSEYFKYYNDFECKPESYQFFTPDKYPSDIKRIWSTCSGTHMFCKRIYFFSESHRKVYKLCSDPMSYHERGEDIHIYCLVDDMNKRCSFCVNDNLIKCTSSMNKIELPKNYR